MLKTMTALLMMLLWDDNIEENFYHTCHFIERCAKYGIIFNPKKFQFAEREVYFVGFRITNSGIKPHPNFVQSIKNFPMPETLKDIRSCNRSLCC